jgi:ATP/maltotriose-dependent transcriptional regulator MalT
MSIPLLTTKLFIPPPRPGLVVRPRLLDRLNASVRAAQRLIVIAAPAGFGKTTLLSAWIAQLKQPRVAWLQLDLADNNRLRFVSYLIAALQTIDPEWGQTAQTMPRTPLSADGDQIMQRSVEPSDQSAAQLPITPTAGMSALIRYQGNHVTQ